MRQVIGAAVALFAQCIPSLFLNTVAVKAITKVIQTSEAPFC